jgi:hypothetical protein
MKIHDTDSNRGGPLSDVQMFGVLGCGYDNKYNSRIGSCKHHAYGDKIVQIMRQAKRFKYRDQAVSVKVCRDSVGQRFPKHECDS